MPFAARPRQRRRPPARALTLSDEWQAWVAENVLLGVPRGELLAVLTADGVPRAFAARAVDAIARSPLVTGARRVTHLVERYELTARLKREVAALAKAPTSIERRCQLPRDEFFERYYAANAPVVVTDALAVWPALSRWSPAYLKERFGDTEVQVMSGRSEDPACDANFEMHCVSTRLGDFCDRVVVSGPTNDFYLVANNRVTKNPAMAALFEDVRPPHDYVDERREPGWISMWFGPAGTVTPLHHDTANVLFCQVVGRKKLTLFPPSELPLLRDVHHNFYSVLDPERSEDPEAFVDVATLSRREVVLSPGEALFIPVGWWHHVRALDVSISLALTNFLRPNQFDWYRPGGLGGC